MINVKSHSRNENKDTCRTKIGVPVGDDSFPVTIDHQNQENAEEKET
jgi:hypothetical protein